MMLRLLIVEDDPQQAAALAELFEQCWPGTHNTVVAELAGAVAQSGPFDVIVLDLGLLDSSGLATLTAVVEAFPAVPVVVLTGTTEADIADKAIELGADDFLVKGVITPGAIRRVVRRAAERNAYRRVVHDRATLNRALAHLGRVALSDVDLDALLDAACRVAAQVLRVSGSAFLELTADRCLLLRSAPDLPRDPLPIEPITLDDDVPAALALRIGSTITVEDVRNDPRFGARRFYQQNGIVTIAAVPVRTETAAEGAIVLWHTERRLFEDHETAFLGALASILAASIQRRRSDAALRGSRREMAQILDAMPARVVRYDRNLRVTYVNESAAGATSFDPIGKHIDEFGLPEPLRSKWQSALERVFASGVTERFDIAGAEQKLKFDVSVVAVQGEDSAAAALVVARDITERVRTESRFETLFASNVVGVVFSGFDGVLTQANRAFLDIIQQTESDVTARLVHFDGLLPLHTRDTHAEKLRELRQRGTVRPYRTELRNRSGERVPVLMASAVVAQVPEEIVSFVIDETATRKAEDLIHSQMLLLNGASDAIMLCDVDGGIRFWNDGATRLYGWTADEAIGTSAFELLYAEKNETTRNAHRIALSRAAWKGELAQTRRDGTGVIVDSRWSVVHPTYDAPPMILVINSDVTEKRSLERQLLQAQRLESLGTLAGGIAHDLNNILMPITLGADHLRLNLTNKAAQATLDRIVESTSRAADLIHQMLVFARGHRVEEEMANPANLIEEVVRILRETLPPSIDIMLNVSREVCSIACDPTQVHQVLLNLCVNARDAMPNGGLLTIDAENVSIDETYARMNGDAAAGMFVMLSVSDNGAGIPAAAMAKIFEPFYTTKPHGSGTGLGLATVRSIVKSHHGFINATSEPGQTVFSVYLPALHDAVTEIERQERPVATGNGELILVIDDEEAIREIIASTLQSYGYRVLTAGDGSEGVALFVQNRDTAVVVTDMLMPVLDGASTIRALRRLNAHVRVIGMSGVTARPGAPAPDVLLQKPFRAADLLSAIQDVLAA